MSEKCVYHVKVNVENLPRGQIKTRMLEIRDALQTKYKNDFIIVTDEKIDITKYGADDFHQFLKIDSNDVDNIVNIIEEHKSSKSPVDPWEMQRTLMESAADEPLPSHYQVDKLSVLYTALILEETAELAAGMTKILARLASDDAGDKEKKQQYVNKDKLASLMAVVDDFLTETSLEIRAILAETEEFKEVLTEAETIEVADAVTDIMVVSAGYSIAAGIDGAKCYDEVVGSNLSKRNPDTGKMVRDNGGKWIKGRNYREPDLKSVLFPQ